MSGLFGSGSKPTPAAAQSLPQVSPSLRLQTSIEGKPRALFYGVSRVPVNIIWYGDFQSVVTVTSTPGGGGGGGGKGGVFGGGQQPSQQGSTQTTVTYSVAVELALGEGPVASVGPRIWASKSLTTLDAQNMGTFLGTDSQAAWSYLTTHYPGEARTYRLTALAVGFIGLGTSPELPNYTFEVEAAIANAAPGVVDANPSEVIADFLGNVDHGVPGWDTGFNGDWTDLSDYCLATGLLISIALIEKTTGNQWLAELIESLNCIPTWSEGVLKIIPRGDQAVTGNGVTYTPPSAPIYNIGDADYLPNQGSSFGGTNSDPVSGQRTAPRNINNIVEVEYLDRANDYNPVIYPASDDTSIRQFGRRNSKGTRGWHWFATPTSGVMAASLALGREKIANRYAFTLRPRFIGLDAGDIISINDSALGLVAQWVRIKRIVENQDRSLSFLVEEYLQGTGAAPLYGSEAQGGSRPNYNEDPGAINVPMIFEPTAELLGNALLQVWVGVSGVDTTVYGGCDVYVSYDGDNYAQVGRIIGSARQGILTDALPIFPVNPTGPTVDEVNTLKVDLSESGGTLISGSQTDALALNTACYIQGEVLSYREATLTGTNRYDLTYLVRGAYGTETSIANHGNGTQFIRLDQGIAQIPFDQTRIGSTIFIKLVPFNVWGGGGKTVADVAPITYTIDGTALRSPLPTVENLTSKFVDNRLNGTWDEIDDFRTGIRYEIRRGDTFAGAQVLGTVAHPPFPFPGDGVYWVSGWVQPVPGLIVLSEFPTSIEVVGATLNNNVVAEFDCQAEGWPGVFVNTGVDSGLNAVRLSGAGDILAITDILPVEDLLDYGGISLSGTYRPRFIVDVGRVAPVQITITLVGTGIPHDQNILADPDILSQPDILGSASTQFVDVFAKVLVSQSSGGSVLDATDFLAIDDVLSYGIPFAAGIKYSPGVYVGRVFAFEFDLSTLDPATLALLLSATITVDVPDRVDSRAIISSVITSLTNITVPIAGVALTFIPDAATEASPFNGGPGGAIGSLPQIMVTWGDEQPGDVLEITNETVAGCTIRIVNAGVGVQRSKVNVFPRGY